MTTTVRYIATIPRQFFEVALTGRQRQWTPTQQQDVSDADAATLIATNNFVPASPPRARSAGQLAGTPSSADIVLSGEFFLYTDPTQRYVVNATGTAYTSAGGGVGGPSTLAATTDLGSFDLASNNPSVAAVKATAAANTTALAAKQGLPQPWTGTTPALASGTAPTAFGTNSFIYTGAGGAVLDGNTFQTGDEAVWNGTAWTKIVLGGGYLGAFASAPALQTAYPAASNFACVALIGAVLYFSNGTAWAARVVTVAGQSPDSAGNVAVALANLSDGAAQQAAISAAIPSSQKGAASGVAPLDGAGKVPVANLPAAVLGALNFQGTYNAATNTPAIVAGNKGFYWKTATAGTSLGFTWNVGDLVVDNGTTIDKIDGVPSEVVSVAGRTGPVVLTSADLTDLAATITTPIATNATAIATKLTAFIAPRTEGATVTLVAADNGGTSITPVACAVTVNTGLGLGFGRGFRGAGVVSFAGSATVSDKRTTGAANPTCALLCTGTDTYDVVGSKA
jgi:hypothetical protein